MKTHHATTNFPGSSDDSVAVARQQLAKQHIEPTQYDARLRFACCNGELELMRLLLAAGADVNAKNERGDTPLSVAAEKGYTDIVELLRAHGAVE